MIQMYVGVDDENKAMLPARELTIFIESILSPQYNCHFTIRAKSLEFSPDTVTLMVFLRSKVFSLRKRDYHLNKGCRLSIRIEDSEQIVRVKEWLTIDFIALEMPELGRNGYYRSRLNIRAFEIDLNSVEGLLEAFELKLKYLQELAMTTVNQYRMLHGRGIDPAAFVAEEERKQAEAEGR